MLCNKSSPSKPMCKIVNKGNENLRSSYKESNGRIRRGFNPHNLGIINDMLDLELILDEDWLDNDIIKCVMKVM